jgi:hypothetical protein
VSVFLFGRDVLVKVGSRTVKTQLVKVVLHPLLRRDSTYITFLYIYILPLFIDLSWLHVTQLAPSPSSFIQLCSTTQIVSLPVC